jgi:hypothetical protein
VIYADAGNAFNFIAFGVRKLWRQVVNYARNMDSQPGGRRAVLQFIFIPFVGGGEKNFCLSVSACFILLCMCVCG